MAQVLVALSGGVDSAVAAALLVEQGHQVVGAMLHLWAEEDNRCCAREAVERACRVAERLGFPFHLVDAEATFESHVVDYFVAEYASGRTPNPCIPCNRVVRFGVLLDEMRARGLEKLATGHYARVQQVGRYRLLRGSDPHKDQSYFLYTLSQEQLARILFPVGGLTKEEVRAIARRMALPVADQPESQDVCFLAGGDYRSFLARRLPHLFRSGPIRDTSGRIVGQHHGLPGYTIGQRKGLGIPSSEPLYVVAIIPDENALVIGPAKELDRSECIVKAFHYVYADPPTAPFRATAQIRYRAQPVGVWATPAAPDRIQVRFDTPQRGVAPGQSLVLYDGEAVLGGGVICGGPEIML